MDNFPAVFDILLNNSELGVKEIVNISETSSKAYLSTISEVTSSHCKLKCLKICRSIPIRQRLNYEDNSKTYSEKVWYNYIHKNIDDLEILEIAIYNCHLITGTNINNSRQLRNSTNYHILAHDNLLIKQLPNNQNHIISPEDGIYLSINIYFDKDYRDKNIECTINKNYHSNKKLSQKHEYILREMDRILGRYYKCRETIDNSVIFCFRELI